MAKPPDYDERLLARLWVWMNAKPGRWFRIEQLAHPSEAIRVILNDGDYRASRSECWLAIQAAGFDILRLRVEEMIDALAKQVGPANALRGLEDT